MSGPLLLLQEKCRRSVRGRVQAEAKMAQVLSFPQNEPNAVTLTVGDIDRLNEGEFLNDSLIDFWCVR